MEMQEAVFSSAWIKNPEVGKAECRGSFCQQSSGSAQLETKARDPP